MNQEILLKIVRTWDLKPSPEYRGFRCANCQKYMHKAWHHWLTKGGYKTSVHFCDKCEKDFRLGAIKINKPRIPVDESKFIFKLPQKINKKIIKIVHSWNNEGRPVYRMFTCDNCGKDMQKAYHIWIPYNKNMIEIHFCKECGDKIILTKKIKGLIYDLDGTIISTQKLHEAGWIYAGKKFNIPITKQMLFDQRGISNQEASLMMVPSDKKYLLEKFKKAKIKYVNNNLNQIKLFPDILKIITDSTGGYYSVWICTSATKIFVKRILERFKELKKIKDNIVWRELYKKEKPSPEALNLTIKKMGLKKNELYYIGDAFSDYKTSVAAKIQFIYFCPDGRNKDSRIPKSIPIISSHKEILKFLV
ncbi:MAG: HAD hydrolase-like protein [bacterium]|nr:HAD hydrolase-like protein [bacterium]